MANCAIATLMSPQVRYSRFSLNGYTVLTGPNQEDPSLMDAAVLFTTIRLVGYPKVEMDAILRTLVGGLKPAIDVLAHWQFCERK